MAKHRAKENPIAQRFVTIGFEIRVDPTSAPKLRATGPALCVKNVCRISSCCSPVGGRASHEFWRWLNILALRDPYDDSL